MISHYRPGTADENAMREVRSYFRAMDRHGLSVDRKTVLDVGAHIGCFTREALDRGARAVVAYEPHPANFALLEKNCPEADCRNAALVSDDRATTPLVVGRKHNPLVGTERFSTARRTTGNLVVVEAVACERFAEAVRGIQVIKFDAEGAEYDVLNAVDLPLSVEFLIGEFDCNGSFRLPDGSMTGTVSRSDYRHLWDLIGRIEGQGFAYHGPTHMRLPQNVFLIHVLFVRKA